MKPEHEANNPLRESALPSATLLGLVSELLDMLESVEESDSGKEFHPTTIQTCRCLHAAKLNEIIPKITAIVRQSPNDRLQPQPPTATVAGKKPKENL